ncbi:MAG: adenylate/guanylate cyclase domain-containing protein [Leptospiraceae bacterium]|nr:adenylate/guanylate cyclase domain-containing protein [Leptospiraceae bacterium]
MKTEHFSSSFQQEFNKQLLISERYRVLLLAVFLSIIFIVYLAVVIFSYEIDDESKKAFIYFPCFLFPFAVFVQLILAKVLSRKLINITTSSSVLRYLNTVLDLSIPASMVFVFMNITTPYLGLSSPPSYLFYAFIILSVLRLDFWLSTFSGFVAALFYGSAIVYAIQTGFETFPNDIAGQPVYLVSRCLALAGSGIIIGVISTALKKRTENALKVTEEKEKVLETFGRHVSPEIALQLINKGGESLEVHASVMFLDIRNFSTFAEKKTPAQVIAFLNSVFEPMIDIINQHEGIINKFLGDGFMAVFGAPIANEKSANLAVSSAHKILSTLNKNIELGYHEKAKIGIGIHSGDIITGNLGSESRTEYTIIGDTVNLAARIESLNKEFNSQILVSEQTAREAQLQLNEYEIFENTLVKGRVEPVKIIKLA